MVRDRIGNAEHWYAGRRVIATGALGDTVEVRYSRVASDAVEMGLEQAKATAASFGGKVYRRGRRV